MADGVGDPGVAEAVDGHGTRAVKYFLWVKTLSCEKCREDIDLFPGYLVADDTRHPRNVLVCATCGELNEVESLERPGRCKDCHDGLKLEGPAHRNRCTCPHCGFENTYPRNSDGSPKHRLFAIEYINPARKDGQALRFGDRHVRHPIA
jgi:DNA-directed RNA polymerase subunit RPC12/RpoP